MPTERQKKLAKALVENALSEETKTAGELLESAGYDKTTAEATPGKIIAQQGVQEAIKEVQSSMISALEKKGITPDYVAERIGVLLSSENEQAIDKGITHSMKIGLGGGYKTDEQEKPKGNITYNIFNNPDVKVLVQNFEEGLKKQLMTPQNNVPIQKEEESAGTATPTTDI